MTPHTIMHILANFVMGEYKEVTVWFRRAITPHSVMHIPANFVKGEEITV